MKTKNVTTAKQSRKNANDLAELQNFTGTSQWYKYMFGLLLTDGAKESADLFQSHWFLDVIASYQMYAKFKGEEFQVWKLIRVKDEAFKVVADDGNGNILVTQEIPFSDFPHDEFTLWLVDKIILLPSEY